MLSVKSSNVSRIIMLVMLLMSSFFFISKGFAAEETGNENWDTVIQKPNNPPPAANNPPPKTTTADEDFFNNQTASDDAYLANQDRMKEQAAQAATATTKSTGSQTPPDAKQILVNISSQSPMLMKFLTALAYVMGMAFMVIGVLKLKQYGEARTQMSSHHSLRDPLMYMIGGVLLVYLDTTVWFGLGSFWKNPNPYGYRVDASEWTDAYRAVFIVVQLFGTIALIRGIVMLTKLGGGHGGQGGMSKAMTHIIGGLLCINLYQLVQVIMVTFGFAVTI